MQNWRLNDSHIIRDVSDLVDDPNRSIEMSGRHASVITRYGNLHPKLTIFFPYYHTGLGARDSLVHEVNPKLKIQMSSGQDFMLENVEQVSFDGIFAAQFADIYPISATVKIYPSTQKPAVFCLYTINNTSGSCIRGRINLIQEAERIVETIEGTVTVSQQLILRSALSNKIDFELDAGSYFDFGCVVQVSVGDPELLDPKAELDARREFIDIVSSCAEFASEHSELDFMYRLAKVRAVESVFDTQIGPMHSPGGGEYYGGIWCNDQAEYAFPLFPYLGLNNDVAIHDYDLFAQKRFESGQFPYSIESAGNFIGKLERGDGAMYAYGASLFLLGLGSQEALNKLLPHIEDCIDFEFSKINEQGIILSQSDELETRFPTGDANLSTNSLFYGALRKAAILQNIAGEHDKANHYLESAARLKEAIERHFGAQVERFNTYRYYEGNNRLRGWICYPLNVGIYDRAQGSRDALLSDKLWSQYGLRVVSGDETVWQRETMYAIRGLFLAGFTNDAAGKLLEISLKYTSGDTAPYITEISPSHKQLAAESALFARIITEGLYGLSPQFDKLLLNPKLPSDWQYAKIRNIKLFDSTLSIDLAKDGNKTVLKCEVEGETVFDGVIPQSGLTISNKHEVNYY